MERLVQKVEAGPKTSELSSYWVRECEARLGLFALGSCKLAENGSGQDCHTVLRSTSPGEWFGGSGKPLIDKQVSREKRALPSPQEFLVSTKNKCTV